MFENADDAARSLEFRFLVDRAIAARQLGHPDAADAFVRAAERLLETAMKDVAYEVSKIASRKGVGAHTALALAPRLSPVQAAAVTTIWLLRGARRPAIEALSGAFRQNPTFNEMMKVLCARAVPPVQRPFEFPSPQVEVAAPHRR